LAWATTSTKRCRRSCGPSRASPAAPSAGSNGAFAFCREGFIVAESIFGAISRKLLRLLLLRDLSWRQNAVCEGGR
jgi:hypothetical protein